MRTPFHEVPKHDLERSTIRHVDNETVRFVKALYGFNVERITFVDQIKYDILENREVHAHTSLKKIVFRK